MRHARQKGIYREIARGPIGGGGAAYLANPTDVFIAGLLVKAKVLVQAEMDVIAVQSVREFVKTKQVLLESARDRRLGMIYGEIA